MKSSEEPWSIANCSQFGIPLMDAIDVTHGKWKLAIVMALLYKGKMRFNEIKQSVDGISSRVLSKELKMMEMNQLVNRTQKNTVPLTVEYELTDHGRTLESVAMALVEWGKSHRNVILQQ